MYTVESLERGQDGEAQRTAQAMAAPSILSTAKYRYCWKRGGENCGWAARGQAQSPPFAAACTVYLASHRYTYLVLLIASRVDELVLISQLDYRVAPCKVNILDACFNPRL